MAKYVVKLTMEEAESKGIVACAHCGYPRNNHFSWGKKTCAHDSTCPGWKTAFRMGKAIKRKKR